MKRTNDSTSLLRWHMYYKETVLQSFNSAATYIPRHHPAYFEKQTKDSYVKTLSTDMICWLHQQRVNISKSKNCT